MSLTSFQVALVAETSDGVPLSMTELLIWGETVSRRSARVCPSTENYRLSSRSITERERLFSTGRR
jgi:hypothetical protein